MENILIDSGTERFSFLPVRHQDLYEFYNTAKKSFWIAEEVDLSNDLEDWNTKLNDNERFFITNVLAFFNNSDGIVNENLAVNFLQEVKYPEARAFYSMQVAIETIHAEAYSLLIETYIKDEELKRKCFNAIDELPAVKAKANWALKWIESSNFAERLIAFIAVEGIFFAGSFCSIFWLKKRGLMPGLCKMNDFINRDETQHCEFAINLYNNHLENKLPPSVVKEILLSALEAEKVYITESLPSDLIGINKKLMIQYLEYVTDQILLMLNIPKIFNVEQPFKFMEGIGMKTKTNFFEKRVTEYQNPNLNVNLNFDDLNF